MKIELCLYSRALGQLFCTRHAQRAGQTINILTHVTWGALAYSLVGDVGHFIHPCDQTSGKENEDLCARAGKSGQKGKGNY